MSITQLRKEDSILALFNKPNHFAGGVVLARTDRGYVTWGFNEDGDTYHGHYFTDQLGDDDLLSAKEDFIKRVKSEIGVHDQPKRVSSEPRTLLMDRLPPMVAVEVNGELVTIKKGEQGYYPVLGDQTDNKNSINRAISNSSGIEIDEYVERAMINGSMFGWSVLGADPENLRSQNPTR